MKIEDSIRVISLVLTLIFSLSLNGTARADDKGENPTPTATPTETPTPTPNAACCNPPPSNAGSNSYGGVVCCEGVVTYCPWYNDVPPGTPGYDYANAVVYCHEWEHRDVPVTCSPEGRYVVGYPQGYDVDAEECVSYLAEIKCLNDYQKLCEDLPTEWEQQTCWIILQNLRASVWVNMKWYCNHEALATPTPIPTPTPPGDKGNNPLP